jgi:hypothetical protein
MPLNKYFHNIVGLFFLSISVQVYSSDSDFIYIELDNGIEITDGCLDSCPLDLFIPEQLDGMWVKSIGYSSFYGDSLNRVEFPSTLTNISDWAFEDTGLKVLQFWGDRPEIATTAFWGNQIENIFYCDGTGGWPGETIQGITPEPILMAYCGDSGGWTAHYDFDQNFKIDALTDGLLFLRYTFGFRGSDLTAGVISNPLANSPSVIEQYLAEVVSWGGGDIDDDGNVDALTDGLLLLRYLFGLRGDSLISGVVSPNANRTSVLDIEVYLWHATY